MLLRVIASTQQKNIPSLLVFRFWGEECVVYNPLSGDTHLLPALHAEILQLITEGIRGGSDRPIDHLMAEYAMSYEEAVEFSSALYKHYKSLGLVDPSWN